MFPFWEDVIAPIVRAVAPRRVVEIGALRGETTTRMLRDLGPGCELHVIDPEPQFDPTEHARAFPGRYVFHQGLSHDILPRLPVADIALVDGDHNWYTVVNELRMLAATAAGAGAPLPVLALHDVCWPYGRRDLYYEPSRIPAEWRQPHRRAGMRPGADRLFARGGMNLTLHNAEREGGPRNGVMTALEDFAAEHPEPLRLVVLPVYYGLAIAVEERRLAENPDLAAALDRFEGPQGQRLLVELGERIRLDEAVFGQAWVRTLEQRVDRATRRYLDVVKAALLDEHHLDNEVRLEYLLSAGTGGAPDLTALRDPARLLPLRFDRAARMRAEGRPLGGDRTAVYAPFTEMGRRQLDRIEAAVRTVLEEGVPGDLVEVGTGRGGGSILMRAVLEADEAPDRQVWVTDPFRVAGTTAEAGANEGSGSDLNQVRDGFSRFGLLDERVRFLQGAPQDALADAPIERVALLRLGEGLGAEAGEVLAQLLPRLSPGAVVVVSGMADADVERAVDDARSRLGVDAPVERIDGNARTWRVPGPGTGSPPADGTPGALERARARAPHPPPTGVDAVALSVVVVFYNMRREAARTLHSLSRAYQRSIEDLDYEVLAVDNGSSPDQRLSAEFVASFGPQFRLVDMGDRARPSPTVALNTGIAMARGEVLALMIDGAHVLTPGVLRQGMTALTAYAPAVVATQQWYLGPSQQQGDAQQAGYDQAAEDRLFERIDWPIDGYRLFEIGHFIGERDWFDGIVESNCLLVPRKLLEQHGGFDDSFSMPGGGYANLDLFERLGLAPDVNAASILGEGSFHQVHGGTTTNVADEAVRRDKVASYGEHFRNLRGRPLIGLNRPVHFVGAMATKAARRTRSRREIGLRFAPNRDPMDPSGAPAPAPVADELKLAAIEAMWDAQAWRAATWLGHPVSRFPTDLQSYQELIARCRPGLVVVVGDDPGLGGRALFAASICDQLDHGRVVAVGRGDPAARPSHPRVTHIEGAGESEDVARSVAALTGGSTDALVLLGLGEVSRVVVAFDRYAPLVGVGGYVVVENTVVNGRPAAPGFGPGPHEAVVAILQRHREFVTDPGPERYTVTFNRNGYLRRLASS